MHCAPSPLIFSSYFQALPVSCLHFDLPRPPHRRGGAPDLASACLRFCALPADAPVFSGSQYTLVRVAVAHFRETPASARAHCPSYSKPVRAAHQPSEPSAGGRPPRPAAPTPAPAPPRAGLERRAPPHSAPGTAAACTAGAPDRTPAAPQSWKGSPRAGPVARGGSGPGAAEVSWGADAGLPSLLQLGNPKPKP